jgi:hypothetical protein
VKYLAFVIILISSFAHSEEWYIGKWEVVDAKFPGMSAMGMSEAKLWFGDIASYTISEISFRGDICTSPTLQKTEFSEDEFYSYYRASFQQLGISGKSVDVLKVQCENNSGVVAAGLISTNNGFVYTLWDGVFFKLKSVP